MVNNLFARWAELVIKLRIPILLLVAAITVVSAWAISNHLIVENDMETFFPADEPHVVDFKHFSQVFGISAFVFVLIETDDPLSLEKMKLVDKLTEAMEEEVPYMEDIVSPTNAELLVNEDDTLRVEKLRDHFDEPQEFTKLVKLFREKEIYRDGLVSEDGRYLGMILNTVSRDLSKTEGEDVSIATAEMTAKIYEILARPEYASLKTYPAGNPIFNDQYGRWTSSETERMFAWIVFLLLILLVFIFRNVRGVVIPVATVVLTVLWTFGIMALTIKMRITSTVLPPLLASVGICDSIHILTEFDVQILRLHDRRKALIETIRMVGYPCLLTSLTTAAGFMSLALTPVVPLQETGIFAATGVMLAFVLTITMVIAAISFGSAQPKRKIKDPSGLYSIQVMDKIYSIINRHRVVTIGIWVILSVVAAVGVSKIVIDADWLRNFGEDIRIRQDYEKADSVMGGSASFEVMIDTGQRNGVKDPEFLKQVAAFKDEISEHEGVHHVISLVDLLKEVRVSLQGDSPESRKPPETRQLAAQLLLLYDMAGGKTLDDVVDGEQRIARIAVRTPFERDSIFKKHFDAIWASLRKNIKVPEENMMVTGYPVMELSLTEKVLPSQINSFAVAFVAIAILLTIFLRSVTLGLVGIIPTTLPVLFALGFMGWAAIYLDWVITMIASVGIGLAVDNAIHLFNRFRHEFNQTGNHERAMHLAIVDVGRALAFTAFILVIGFMVTGTSVMENVANFGKLSAMLIGVSFLTAIALAPPLLVIFKPFGKDRTE